jgi:Leucine-rich repeat (LRR) protein
MQKKRFLVYISSRPILMGEANNMKAYNLNTARQHCEAVTELYLHHCGLSEVPPLVFRCSRLRRLEITDNALRFIPERLAELKHLEVLNLSGNRIQRLPETLSALTGLTHLDMRNNQLKALPPALLALSALEILCLAGNQLTALPEDIDRWQRLGLFDISDNDLSQLPAAMGRLVNLREFYGSRNGLHRLPKAFAQLSMLERLEVADNRLRKLPESFFSNMERLSQLDLSGNRLLEIPSSIGKCRHLVHLSAARNKLKALPPDIGRLGWLRRLDLSKNKLSFLPTQITGCSFIRRLNLSENNLSVLPPSIGRLHRLEQFSLARNRLEDLPGLPPALLVLDLAHNRLERIPPSLLALPALREVDLGYNRLSRLPPEFSKLEELRQLRLTGNEIADWRAVILNLDQLETLHGPAVGREKRRLLRFLKACRQQKTSREARAFLFDCYQGEAEVLDQLSLDQLMEALRFPLKEVRLAVRRHLISRRGASLKAQPLKAGAKIACIGKVHFEEADLRSRLSQQGISLVATAEEAGHVVIGDRPPATVQLGTDQVFLSEVQLNEFFDRSGQRYLAREDAGAKAVRVRQLLLHEKPRNVRLAIQLMKGGGVPASLLTELFFVWKRTPQGKLKNEIRALLELNLPESDRAVLSIRRSLSEGIPAVKLEENIRRFAGNTVLNEGRLRVLCGLKDREKG